MFLSKFKKTNKEQSRAITGRDMTIYGLMALCLLMAVAVLAKKPVVVVTPSTINGNHEITSSTANAQYKQDWGLAFATILGNTTPDNIETIIETIKPYLHPSIYQPTVLGLHEEAQALSQEKIVTYFKLLAVRYQHSRDLVFITGDATTEGTVGKPNKQKRTYEFRIGVDSYRPVILSFRAYAGEPRLKGGS